MRRGRRRRKVGKHISLSATDADWEIVRRNAKRRGLSIARYLVELVERDASEEDAGPALALTAEEQRELLEAVREVRALMLEGEDAGLPDRLQRGDGALRLAPGIRRGLVTRPAADVAVGHRPVALHDVALVGEAAAEDVGEDGAGVAGNRDSCMHGAVSFMPVSGIGGDALPRTSGLRSASGRPLPLGGARRLGERRHGGVVSRQAAARIRQAANAGRGADGLVHFGPESVSSFHRNPQLPETTVTKCYTENDGERM